MLKMCI